VEVGRAAPLIGVQAARPGKTEMKMSRNRRQHLPERELTMPMRFLSSLRSRVSMGIVYQS
jgi:hypothetical protein